MRYPSRMRVLAEMTEAVDPSAATDRVLAELRDITRQHRGTVRFGKQSAEGDWHYEVPTRDGKFLHVSLSGWHGQSKSFGTERRLFHLSAIESDKPGDRGRAMGRPEDLWTHEVPHGKAGEDERYCASLPALVTAFTRYVEAA